MGGKEKEDRVGQRDKGGQCNPWRSVLRRRGGRVNGDQRERRGGGATKAKKDRSPSKVLSRVAGTLRRDVMQAKEGIWERQK